MSEITEYAYSFHAKHQVFSGKEASLDDIIASLENLKQDIESLKAKGFYLDAANSDGAILYFVTHSRDDAIAEWGQDFVNEYENE